MLKYVFNKRTIWECSEQNVVNVYTVKEDIIKKVILIMMLYNVMMKLVAKSQNELNVNAIQ